MHQRDHANVGCSRRDMLKALGMTLSCCLVSPRILLAQSDSQSRDWSVEDLRRAIGIRRMTRRYDDFYWLDGRHSLVLDSVIPTRVESRSFTKEEYRLVWTDVFQIKSQYLSLLNELEHYEGGKSHIRSDFNEQYFHSRWIDKLRAAIQDYDRSERTHFDDFPINNEHHAFAYLFEMYLTNLMNLTLIQSGFHPIWMENYSTAM